MAHIDSIWFQSNQIKMPDCSMKVYVKLKPAGSTDIVVSLPPDFYDAIMKIAQLAADKHEQEMRMQILADSAKDTQS